MPFDLFGSEKHHKDVRLEQIDFGGEGEVYLR